MESIFLLLMIPLHSYSQIILQYKIKKVVTDDPSTSYNDMKNDAIAQVYMRIMGSFIYFSY